MKRFIAALSLAITLTACSALALPTSVPAPTTLNQRIIAADAAAQALFTTAAAAEKSGVVKPGSELEKVLRTSFSSINAALAQANTDIQKGDTDSVSVLLGTAEGAISGVKTALDQINTETK